MTEKKANVGDLASDLEEQKDDAETIMGRLMDLRRRIGNYADIHSETKPREPYRLMVKWADELYDIANPEARA